MEKKLDITRVLLALLGQVLMVLLELLMLVLILTDPRVVRCCVRPIWRNQNHEIDAYVYVYDREIQSDTYRNALQNTVRFSQIHTYMHCFQELGMHMWMGKNTGTYIQI
jgi:hypothetical protein